MTSISEAVELHVDWDGEDFRLHLLSGFTSQDVKAALTAIDAMGLEPLDSGEDADEILKDGSVRVWLAEKNPR